jgi:hypothetical protein
MNSDAKVNNEIEEMLTAFGNPTPENLKPDEEEPGAIATPEVSEVPEVPKTPETPEAPKDSIVSEEPEETEKTDKDKIIENLRQRLNEKPELPLPKKEGEEPEKPPVETPAEPLKLEEQDFIGDLDLDDLTRDKVALNKILNTVYTKGVNDSKRIATEEVLSTIPDIVKQNFILFTELKEARNNFYEENKDLVPFERVVATVFGEVSAKNPEKNYIELMNLTAPEVRKRLELPNQVKNTPERKEEKPPRLPGVRSNQRQSQHPEPQMSAVEKEISEMNSILRR